MKIQEIKGNLKTLQEQREAIINRLDKFDRRIAEIEEKVNKLENEGETT